MGEWFVKINDRSSGINCPACAGRVITDLNRLSIIFPEISQEWHPTKNGSLTPDDVSYGLKEKVWWICPEGHEYLSPIHSRTSGRGCKKCYDERKESLIAYELKKYFLHNYEGEEEYSILINPETGYPLPFDIYLFGGENQEINGVYIEVHGEQHYKLCNWHHRQAKRNETNPEYEFEYQKKKDRIKRKFARILQVMFMLLF